jgi:hypothetical protein
MDSEFPMESARAAHASGLGAGMLAGSGAFAVALIVGAAILGAWLGYLLATRSFAHRRRLIAEHIHGWIAWHLERALEANVTVLAPIAARLLPDEIRRHFGPMLDLSKTLSASIKSIDDAIDDKLPVTPVAPTSFKRVGVTPAQVSVPQAPGDLKLAGEGLLVAEPNIDADTAQLEHRARIYASVRKFAAYWQSRDARVADIQGVQRRLTEIDPGAPPLRPRVG